MGNPFLGFTARPTLVAERKSGALVPWVELQEKLEQTILLVKSFVTEYRRELKSDSYYKYLADNINPFNPDPDKLLPSSLNEAARVMGIRFQEEYPKDAAIKSRLDRLVGHNILSDDKSYGRTLKGLAGEEKITQGWAKTICDNQPEPSPVIDLSACDSAYTKMTQPDENGDFTLELVGYDKWYILHFTMPREIYDTKKITLPKLVLDEKTHTVSFHFAAERERQYPEITTKFTIGVDPGISNYYTAVVYNTLTGEMVDILQPSQKIRSLIHDINQAETQVTNLYKAIKKHRNNRIRRQNARRDLLLQRKAASKKKREVAILAAQELIDLSLRYENALIGFEYTGWVKNTMANGRWNRGEFSRWVKHFANHEGILCYNSPSANTTRKCSKCKHIGPEVKGDTFECNKCGFILHRDINAALNMAIDIVPRAKSSAITRKQTRAKKKPSQLKHNRRIPKPNRAKTGPTPKQPKNNHRKEVTKPPTRSASQGLSGGTPQHWSQARPKGNTVNSLEKTNLFNNTQEN